EHAVAVGLRHAVGLDDDVAESRPRRDRDLERLRALVAGLREHGLVVLQARLALRLAGARRHPDPLELARERPLARGVGLLLPLEPFLLLLEPRGVVALPRDAVAAGELERPVEVPGVRRVDPVLQARLLLEELLHLVGLERLAEPGAHRLEPRQQRARLGDALLDVATHVLRRIELRLLREVADAEAG